LGTYVQPPKTPEQGYHLSEDLADDAIGWLQNQKAFTPDKPFYMYWASDLLAMKLTKLIPALLAGINSHPGEEIHR